MNVRNLRKKKTKIHEIRKFVAELNESIEKNRNKNASRKYETFFAKIGMKKRRDFDELKRYQKEFEKQNITFWSGKNQIYQLSEFKKNSTITFKKTLMSEQKEMNGTAEVKFAGKITISKSESGITPYKHQEDAFYNLQKQIIKSDKNPFAGLLVLPTGGGKTLTASWWIA